jgi:hypothetical protein
MGNKTKEDIIITTEEKYLWAIEIKHVESPTAIQKLCQLFLLLIEVGTLPIPNK